MSFDHHRFLFLRSDHAHNALPSRNVWIAADCRAYLIEPQLCQTSLILFNTLQPLKLIVTDRHIYLLSRRVVVMNLLGMFSSQLRDAMTPMLGRSSRLISDQQNHTKFMSLYRLGWTFIASQIQMKRGAPTGGRC